MDLKEQRKNEDEQYELTKNAKVQYNGEVVKLINNAIKTKHNVWLMTDWHLWIKGKQDKLKCTKRHDFNDVISNIKRNVKSEDVLIYLGDIVDGEFQNKDELKSVLRSLPGKKILIRGNNDLFSFDYYRESGFRYVLRTFVWNGVVFSHCPLKHKNEYNIHGHIHQEDHKIRSKYWVPYNNHIDVAYLGGRKKPVKLMDCINAVPEYSKLAKEDPKHFNEYVEQLSLFDQIQETMIIQDPWDD